MSCCRKAEVAAKMAVKDPTIRVVLRKAGVGCSMLVIRISRKTPATTIVELWRRADTGVGPSIAAGSHGCNPNCADLPIAPISAAKSIMEVHHWSSFPFRE